MCSQYNTMNHGHRLRHAVENTRVLRRKFMKHMVEKRRRNRINDCLENMRSMVLAQMGKNPSNYTKMEKADILEMTVKFVETLKKKPQQPKSSSSPVPGQDFDKGYQACQQEIAKFLDMAAFPQDLKIRLNQHLRAKHSPSTSTITSSSPQTPIQPKVVPPQEFTAMLSRAPVAQPISARDQYHVSPPMVLHPGAYHPHYMHSPHFMPGAYPPTTSQSGVPAVSPAEESHKNPLCQPLSIEIKPEVVSPPVVNVPRLQPPMAEHPDSDDDVWRPW